MIPLMLYMLEELGSGVPEVCFGVLFGLKLCIEFEKGNLHLAKSGLEKMNLQFITES